ncbi:hypothetical protein CYMTET_10104 [Cymbomonas tetramitiformis]|uniref:EF-hand domain-containing protein n=1 Tax=Cymbomonas tetramitiformis TaxID=36881 RepID=A0AAE0GQE9_9CHLO|nr:hypothetical protein CYMTET_10104 [Cymbomonas tetramitiformis]
MDSRVSALLWGLGSAASFPLGAFVGLNTNFSHNTLAMLLAFGAGTLIFAVTVELFGELLDRVRDGEANFIDVTYQFVSAIVGALLYMYVNQIMLRWEASAAHWRQLRSDALSNFGKAYLRVVSTTGLGHHEPGSPSELETVQTIFKMFNGSNAGTVTAAELMEALQALGHNPREGEVELLMEEAGNTKKDFITLKARH